MREKRICANYPPPPILPPYGKLEKITGHLETFHSEAFREYFGVRAYRTNPLPDVTENQRGGAAALATLAGSPATGALLMSSSETEYSVAEYVQGIINGKPFRGWVGMTRLKPGDKVEMAAEWQEDHYQVYAITLPQERIISICPRCETGHIAQARLRVKNMFILTAIMMGMFIIFQVGDAYFNGFKIELLRDHIEFNLMMLTISFVGSMLIAISAYKAYAPTTCRLAEEIYQVLGMNDVAKINLQKITKQREQELKSEGRWYSPLLKHKPWCPDWKIFTLENWYYY